MFATGVTVVTTGGNLPHGMTANAFTSVSLDPALVLVCVKRSAVLHEAMQEQGTFVVSILAGEQEATARYFASRQRPRDEREFADVPYFSGPLTGAPILTGCLAWLECKLTNVYDGGDHGIFVGSVLGIGHQSDRDALVFHGGRFFPAGRAA
ncbi:flavin reductase family protein [Micromonospora sp. NPDC048935]|uniref:flavin reductase family protein n=1 Tax=Micromonospora sp. NPDC048935 TaxID=3364262 RepID=UPI00370FD49C